MTSCGCLICDPLAGAVPGPAEAARRKAHPVCTGVLDYFPDALLEVAALSRIGNEQHNPGEPLHWAKDKSTDNADALLRHLIDRRCRDTDGVRHSAKVAWRALALLQREIESEEPEKPDASKPDASGFVTACVVCHLAFRSFSRYDEHTMREHPNSPEAHRAHAGILAPLPSPAQLAMMRAIRKWS